MDGSNRIEELEQKFAENPRRFFAPLANEYRKAGDPKRAIEICRAHLGQLPGHMSGQVVYGQALFECGDYAEARTVFENALGMDRENLIVLRHLGDLSLREGDAAQAKQWYTRVLEIDPKDAAAIALVNEIDDAADASPPEAPAAPEPAPIPVEKSAVIEAEEEPAPPPKAFVTETMAELYLTQGFTDLAIDTYRQLAELHPESDQIRARLAELEAPGEPRSSEPAPEPELEPAVARHEEPAPVEAPEPQPDEDRSTSIEEPTTSVPAGAPPSEESPGDSSDATDSPPSSKPPSDGDSVESPVSDEPRAEPEGRAARQPTMREFFAIIGSRRPARRYSGNAGSNGHSGAASTAAEDHAAAVALAGAFSATGVSYESSVAESAPSAPKTAAARESDEDMARFRAWLDGLASE
jgi:tetratricopeptide (TPR) repeat protein